MITFITYATRFECYDFNNTIIKAGCVFTQHGSLKPTQEHAEGRDKNLESNYIEFI